MVKFTSLNKYIKKWDKGKNKVKFIPLNKYLDQDSKQCHPYISERNIQISNMINIW